MRKKIYDETMAEMKRALALMTEDLGDPPSDLVPTASDLITHMGWWFAIQLAEEKRAAGRASLAARSGE